MKMKCFMYRSNCKRIYETLLIMTTKTEKTKRQLTLTYLPEILIQYLNI
jgi:hypothetical protein